MKKVILFFIGFMLVLNLCSIELSPVMAYDDYNEETEEISIEILLCTPNRVVYEVDNLDLYSDMIMNSVTVNGISYAAENYYDYDDEDDGIYLYSVGDGELYESNYSAKIGDVITVNVELKNGNIITKTEKIKLGDGNISIKKCNVNNVRYVFTSDTSAVKSSYIEMNGKKYISKSYDSEDEDFDEEPDYYEEEDMYNIFSFYQVKYYAKVGDTVKVIVETKDGYKYSKIAKIKQITPKLKINKVYVGDTMISGSTVAKSNVTIRIKNKTYKTKSNSKGNFSKKIKAFKRNTKIKTKVITPQKCTVTKTIKVKMLYSDIKIPNYIYKTSNKVIVKVYDTRKGDKVKLKVGKRVYTKKIKSKHSTKNIVFKIKKASAGTKVIASYYNKFSNRKGKYKDMVYYGDYIYKGMSAKNATLTTWGKPVRRNDYNGNLQWIFESGQKTLYAHIRSGVVYSITVYNY